MPVNWSEYIKDKKLAEEMFDTLIDIFERKSIANQVILRKQSLSMKYQDGDSIVNHFLAFDTKIRSLKDTGARMEELDVVVHLLLTLPKSFDGLVTAIETMDSSRLTIQFAKTRLIDECNKRGGINTNSRKSLGDANAMLSNIICHKCGKRGHTHRKVIR